VVIMRQTGVDDAGSPIGEEISPHGEIRTFTWK
jgi:hypothetical protein